MRGVLSDASRQVQNKLKWPQMMITIFKFSEEGRVGAQVVFSLKKLVPMQLWQVVIEGHRVAS